MVGILLVRTTVRPDPPVDEDEALDFEVIDALVPEELPMMFRDPAEQAVRGP